MLKPSYAELMDVLNQNSEQAVTSRYSVVIASAKRARQIIDGDEPMIDTPVEGKPLSTAVEEIYEGKVKIVPEGEGTVLNLRKNSEKNLMAELESAINEEKEAEQDTEEFEAVSDELEAEKADELDDLDDVDLEETEE